MFHRVKKNPTFCMFSIGPLSLKFYAIAIVVAILVNYMWLKKNHERVGQATYFFVEDLLGLPGLPKKFLVFGGPTPYGIQDRKIGLFGGPRYHRGWDPQTPKFFWEVQEVPIGPPQKIKWLVQLFHVFF